MQAARINEELMKRHEQMMKSAFNQQIKQYATGNATPKPPTLVACRRLASESFAERCVGAGWWARGSRPQAGDAVFSACAADDSLPDNEGGMRGWDNDDAPAPPPRERDGETLRETSSRRLLLLLSSAEEQFVRPCHVNVTWRAQLPLTEAEAPPASAGEGGEGVRRAQSRGEGKGTQAATGSAKNKVAAGARPRVLALGREAEAAEEVRNQSCSLPVGLRRSAEKLCVDFSCMRERLETGRDRERDDRRGDRSRTYHH